MGGETDSPYVAGSPLRTTDVFYGRDEIFERIGRKLRGKSQDNPILLYGQRRTGKTSILFQIKNDESRLGPEYFPVYVNLQSMGLTARGMSGFLYDVSSEISQATGIDKPRPSEFLDNPQAYFRHTFLPHVHDSIDNKQLLLLFDEYETLGNQVRDGTLEEGVFPFLRAWMAEDPHTSFVFAGNHKPGELSENYTIAFGKTLLEEIQVSFLEEDEAARLITDPVDGLMRYDDVAVDAILELTSGHPFFIQLICEDLFSRYAPQVRSLLEGEPVRITREGIREILDRAIASGENQLQEIWNEFIFKERVVLAGASAALSRVEDQDTLVPDVHRADIDDALRRFSSRFEVGEVTRVLEGLVERGILISLSPRYRFAVDLLRRWIYKSQDLRELAIKLPVVIEEEEPAEWPRTARVAIGIVATLFFGLCLVTGWYSRDLWFPFIQTSTPTATTTLTPTPPTPTLISTFTLTPTFTPTNTLTPTYTPTATPTPTYTPTNTPVPTPLPVRPELLEPLQGRTYGSPVTFRWSGSLRPGQAYQVTAYHSGSGYTILSGGLTTQEWIAHLPAEQQGDWRWKVSVVENGSELIDSFEWMFWFDLGGGGNGGDVTPTDPPHK